jgi:hypothetical protein
MDYLCASCNSYKPQAFFVSINGKIHKCKKCMDKNEHYGYSVIYDRSLIRKIKNLKKS